MVAKKSPAKKSVGVARKTGTVPTQGVFIPRNTNLMFPTRPSTKFAGRTKNGKIKDHKKNPETAAQVELLASIGLTAKEIAVVLDIRPGQVNYHYGDVIESSPVRANFQVAYNVLSAAKGRPVGTGKNAGVVFDRDLAKFWLNHRAGFKSATGLELTGKDGVPLETARVNVYVPENPRRKVPRSTPES